MNDFLITRKFEVEVTNDDERTWRTLPSTYLVPSNSEPRPNPIFSQA